MDTFITVDMCIFIVMAFLWTPLIKNQILRYVVYKPHSLLLLLLLLHVYCIMYKLDIPVVEFIKSVCSRAKLILHVYSIMSINILYTCTYNTETVYIYIYKCLLETSE